MHMENLSARTEGVYQLVTKEPVGPIADLPVEFSDKSRR